jgi:hypothetical protein
MWVCDMVWEWDLMRFVKIKVNDKWLINEYNRVEVDCIFVKINIRRIELEKEMELVIIGR